MQKECRQGAASVVLDAVGTRICFGFPCSHRGIRITLPYMISIVIPFFNEAESLAILYGEIDQVALQAGLSFELILVDDGSRDGSWGVAAELAAKFPRVRGIRLRRN